MVSRIHLREIRKQYPDLPDCCHRCQLFLHGKYRAGSARMDALDSKVATVYDTPEQVVGTACSAIQCTIPDALRTKTGKIPSTYIQLCSQFVQEDIEALNPDMIATYGEAAKESIKHLGLDKKIDTCHMLTTKGERNESAHNRIQYYKEHHTFIKPEYAPFDMVAQWITNDAHPEIGLDFEWKVTDAEVGIVPHTIGIGYRLNGKYYYTHSAITHPVRQLLFSWVRDGNVTFVAHDAARAEIQRLFDLGLHPSDFKCKWVCTMVTSWELLKKAGDVSLKGLGYKHLPIENYWKDIDVKNLETYTHNCGEYCGKDAWLGLFYLHNLIAKYEEHYSVMQPAHTLDMRMLLPTAYAMWKGIGVSFENIHKARELAEQRIANHQSYFNTIGVRPTSRDEVIDYAKFLGLKIPTTDAKYLQALTDLPEEQKELIDHLLSYRQYNTALTRYLNDEWLSKEIVHSYIQIAKANTGRPAYGEPNIANIPEDLRFIIQSTHGEDGILGTWDRQGSEYRVAAYLTAHDKLCQAFIDGVDIHTFASNLTGVPRRPVKTLNFQYLYWGSEPATIALLEAEGVQNAKDVYIKYDQEMNMIRKWQQRLIDRAYGAGYIQSPTGRRGYRLKPTNIVNFPFQSWSSDLNKETLLFFFDRMLEEGMSSHIWCEFYDGTEIDIVKEELPMLQQIAGECYDMIPDIFNRDLHIPFPLDEKLHGRYWGEQTK